MFPNGVMKALTLSYDDGVEQDKKLAQILNRYSIKATFNLNSGIQTGANRWQNGDVEVRRMNINGLPAVYEGHEIAVHSLTHPHLENLDGETIQNELEQDRLNLERIFGRRVGGGQVCGMAYPFGTYNDLVVETARRCGMRYARGVKSTYYFDVPEDLLVYQPTIHHKDARLMELAESFIKLKAPRPQVFYLWGHSYEFDIDRNWQVIEDFCRLMAGRDDIFYATNAQALLGV
jgi:peptidoglycan/xylan/chitin deacetylase (PgdA/CDA1 family)